VLALVFAHSNSHLCFLSAHREPRRRSRSSMSSESRSRRDDSVELQYVCVGRAALLHYHRIEPSPSALVNRPSPSGLVSSRPRRPQHMPWTMHWRKITHLLPTPDERENYGEAAFLRNSRKHRSCSP
jgi:hypothetical protein